MLLDLPGEVRLSWHVEDDPEVGIPVTPWTWRFEADQVRLWLGLE